VKIETHPVRYPSHLKNRRCYEVNSLPLFYWREIIPESVVISTRRLAMFRHQRLGQVEFLYDPTDYLHSADLSLDLCCGPE